MDYPFFVKEKLADLVHQLDGLSTAISCVEDSRAREISQRKVNKVLGDAHALKLKFEEWGAEPASTPSRSTAPTPHLVLHDMKLWQVLTNDGMHYLNDGHFNRSGVDLLTDSFPVTLLRLETTRGFERNLDQFFGRKTKGSVLNAEAIRKHATGLWYQAMVHSGDPLELSKYVNEFTDFLQSVDLQLEAIQSIRVENVAVFDLQS